MSDNELDAELLGMVGGESDDEGEDSVEQTQTYDAERSPSEEAKESVERVAEEPARRTKGVAQKVRKGRRKARKQESEDEDDLGGGSPSEAESFGSGAMDESDGDADAARSPEDEERALCPLEGKYTSAQDREDILALPEIERETLLAQRAEEVTKRNQDLQLKKALAATRAAASKHKRKRVDDDDTARRTRPKAEKKPTALDDYKRARELKGTDRGRLETSARRRDDRSPSSAGSDRDADGESEVEWAEPSSDSRRQDEQPADIKEFERCRIGRSNFAKVCFYPGFDDAIKGCFARVSIGPNRQTGQPEYRMTQVKSFTEGKPYQMESSNGKHFSTDVYAVVAHGNAEKPWPFSACSDGKFIDQEFDRYMSTLKKDNVRVPTKKYLEARLDAIHKLLNIEWNDAAITQKLANQRAMEKKLDPASAAKRKRESIMTRKQKAEEDGDVDEIMKCDAELAALENTAQSSTINGHGHASNGIKASPIRKAAAGGSVQYERLAQLNMKNRGKNVEDVKKALIEERKRLEASRKQAAAEAKIKAEAEAEKARKEAEAKLLAVPKGDMSDLFGDSDASRAGTPVPGGTPRRSRAGTPLNGIKKEKSGLGVPGVVGALKKKSMDDEVIGNLDLGIDVEI